MFSDMSYSKFTPSNLPPRKTDLQLLNGLFHLHDLACQCESPESHLTYLITTNCKPTKFTPEEFQKIKQCLGITTGEDPTTQEDTAFDAGDLRKNFSKKYVLRKRFRVRHYKQN